ncbi:MAG: sugar-binding transcriptional regulator [Paracoccaceae bacterium]
MNKENKSNNPELTLSTRAAWLHYVGGHKQSDVAKILGVTSVKAHRMISKAVADGLVKVSIDGEAAECVALERKLAERFDLRICEVAPDLHEQGLPLRALGMAGASFLRRQLELGDHKLIGIGHGRTLSAAFRQLPSLDAKQTRFVSLLGGLTRNFSANPHDVMHMIAEKTKAHAYVMPVPFFANTAEDRSVLVSQNGVSDVFALAENSTLKFVGVGTVGQDTQLVLSGMIEPEEITEVTKQGGVGELLGHFFNAKGELLETTLTARTLAVSVGQELNGEVVALVGGQEKIEPLLAVLKSGQLSGLLTDEQTATAILARIT